MCVVLTPSLVSAQATEWRTSFADAQAAMERPDTAAYADAMAEAAGAMPDGLLNRPLIQYHAARGAAMLGRTEAAVRWLRTAWEEDIEALMISLAPFDPAFSQLIGTDGFEAVMGLAANMERRCRSRTSSWRASRCRPRTRRPTPTGR